MSQNISPLFKGLPSILQKQLPEYRFQDTKKSIGVFRDAGLGRLQFIASIRPEGQTLKICTEEGTPEAISNYLQTGDANEIANQVRSSCNAIKNTETNPLYVQTSEVCGLLPLEEENESINPLDQSFSIEVSESTLASPIPQVGCNS